MKQRKNEAALIIMNVALALATLACGALSAAGAISTSTLLTITSMVIIVALTGATLLLLRMGRKRNDRERERWDHVNKILSQIAWRTSKVPDIAGTVSRSRELISNILENALISPVDSDERSELGAVAPPSAATKAIRAAGPPTRGRNAGSGGERPENSHLIFNKIGNPPATSSSQQNNARPGARIGFVAHPEATEALSEFADVLPIIPGTARATSSQHPLEIVVIDERAFDAGPWTGGLSAQGTALFIELWDMLRSLRTVGVLIALLKHDLPDKHFQGDLESQCDLLVVDHDYSLSLGEGARIDALDWIIGQLKEADQSQ